jgi:lipoprotein-releasing system ATP-binding protein
VALIEISDIVKSFGQVFALNGVNLSMEEGGQYAIRGASGSGKSTLLYLLGGLDRPTGGIVKVAGQNLASLDDNALALYRNAYVGFVFQFHFLLPSMDCWNNILLPSQIGGQRPENFEESLKGLADSLGVTHCLKKFPFELSGGEQQRINIIRALSLRPKLLLCDEPTGNLDSDNSNKVTTLLKQLSAEFGSTLVVVTHDNNVASQFDEQIFMQDGKLIETIPAHPGT